MLEALGIHRPPLDGVVLDDLVGPLAELDGALVLDFEANGDDRLQAVVLRLVALPSAAVIKYCLTTEDSSSSLSLKMRFRCWLTAGTDTP